MKQWISDRLLTIKRGAAFGRGILSWKMGVVYFALYFALILQWLFTHTGSAWNLLPMLTIVSLIDCLSFAQGIKTKSE